MFLVLPSTWLNGDLLFLNDISMAYGNFVPYEYAEA
jgi:hypothetical protein